MSLSEVISKGVKPPRGWAAHSRAHTHTHTLGDVTFWIVGKYFQHIQCFRLVVVNELHFQVGAGVATVGEHRVAVADNE